VEVVMMLSRVEAVEVRSEGRTRMLADAMEDIFRTVYEQEAWARTEDAIDRQIRYGLPRRSS
jgi:hypothetical protein